MAVPTESELDALHHELEALKRRLSEREQQAQEAVRVSDEILRQLPDPVIITDVNGVILRWMGAAERVFGYTAAEAIGQTTAFLYPREAREAIVDIVTESIQTAGFYSGELSCVSKDGSCVDIDVSIKPVRNRNGSPMFLVAVGRDISRRKQMEEELRALNAELERRVEQRTADLVQSNEDLKQFAYVASHDLKEPLRTIVSYTQLLDSRYKGSLDGDARDFLQYIVDAAQRMSALINDLLSYSRVANVDNRPLEPVNLQGVVAGIELSLHKMIQENGATITSDDLPEVEGDELQLIRLFQNLVENAIKYRRPEEPPRIHISVEHEGSVWHFRVTDNGIGIDPAYYERIFGLFKRLHGRNIPGTGLGLAICRKIIDRHRGKIWVESQEGVGSTFHFTLPA